MAVIVKFSGKVVSIFKTLIFMSLAAPLLVQSHPDLQNRIDHINHKLSVSPNNADLYLQRAVLQIEHQAWSQASDDIKKAQTLQPKNPQFLYYKGLLHLALKKNELAVKSLTQFILSADKNKAKHLIIKAKLFTGDILFNTKNYEPAAHYFHDVLIEIDQPTASIYYTTAHAYQLAGNSHFKQSLRIANQGLQIFPGFLPLLEIKIEMANQVGNHIEQIVHIQSLLKKYPNHIKWIKELNKLNASYANDSK